VSQVTKNYGGGILICGGSHILDLVLFFLGRPRRVFATMYTPEDRDYDLQATALIETDNGTVLYEALAHPLTKIGFLRDGWDERIEITGTRGRLEIFSVFWNQGQWKASMLVHYDNATGLSTEYRYEPISPFDRAVAYFCRNIESHKQGGQSRLTGYEVDELITQILDLRKYDLISCYLRDYVYTRMSDCRNRKGAAIMNPMTSKQRMLTAINGRTPDRLPVTTHHIMPYFLKKYMNGTSNDEFFDYFKLGTILELGGHDKHSIGLHVGQKVIIESATPCGRCTNCRNARQELCTDIQSFFHLGYFGFAEETIVPAISAIVCDDLKPDIACLSEPLGIAIDVVRLADIQMGANVLIMGPGPIGLMALALVKRAGARRVFVSGFQKRSARVEISNPITMLIFWILANLPKIG
jgi:hypothetical protein